MGVGAAALAVPCSGDGRSVRKEGKVWIRRAFHVLCSGVFTRIYQASCLGEDRRASFFADFGGGSPRARDSSCCRGMACSFDLLSRMYMPGSPGTVPRYMLPVMLGPGVVG